MGINIQANTPIQKLHNFWNNIHFHPTDAIEDDWGQKILNEAAADRIADIVRLYTMFEDIVTVDADGTLHYDFTLNDIRMDYMISRGFRLLVCYNFIPPFLARNSGVQNNVSKNKTRYKGKMITTSPPKDYAVWEEICYRYTQHIVDRYGLDTVKSWYLHCYNEPDIKAFWMSDLPNDPESLSLRLQEYCMLYDSFERGINRVSRDLTIGGPTLAHHEPFLDGFLEHITKTWKKLDFVCYHSYGTGVKGLNENTIPFNTENNIRKMRGLNNIIRKHFPDGIPYIIDEWGASTNGFYNIEECPKFIFRETEAYAAYFCKLVTHMIQQNITPSSMMICLSGQHEMTQDFSGFRNFFTLNFIKKPIYNAYILMRKLRENLLPAQVDNPHVTALATGGSEGYAIALTYTTENFDHELPDITEHVTLCGLSGCYRATVHRIDRDHTNPYGIYCRENMDKDLSAEQINRLREAGKLQPCDIQDIMADAAGNIQLDISLSTNAFVMIELEPSNQDTLV